MTKIIIEVELGEEATQKIIDGVHAKIKADAQKDKSEVVVEDVWIKSKDAAKLLGINPATVKKRINKEGYYKGKFDGGQWMVSKNSLTQYMEN